jgi:D-alanyl-D-alanine carboxypeptidase
MSLIADQAAFLLDVSTLIRFATDSGMVVTGGELWRTVEQQKIYVNQGLSKTMDSNHLKRLAIDLNFFVAGQLATVDQIKPLGAFWESLDPCNRWGGNFKNFTDAPHFERNLGEQNEFIDYGNQLAGGAKERAVNIPRVERTGWLGWQGIAG